MSSNTVWEHPYGIHWNNQYLIPIIAFIVGLLAGLFVAHYNDTPVTVQAQGIAIGIVGFLLACLLMELISCGAWYDLLLTAVLGGLLFGLGTFISLPPEIALDGCILVILGLPIQFIIRKLWSKIPYWDRHLAHFIAEGLSLGGFLTIIGSLLGVLGSVIFSDSTVHYIAMIVIGALLIGVGIWEGCSEKKRSPFWEMFVEAISIGLIVALFTKYVLFQHQYWIHGFVVTFAAMMISQVIEKVRQIPLE